MSERERERNQPLRFMRAGTDSERRQYRYIPEPLFATECLLWMHKRVALTGRVISEVYAT